MNKARWIWLGTVLLLATGPGGSGCSCKDSGGSVAEDLNLLANPTVLNYGTVALGQSKTLTVTLTHVGTSGVVEMDQVYLEGVKEQEFQVEGPEVKTLAVGESTEIRVTYTPKDSLADFGYLVITHNVAQQGNVTRISLTANGQVGDLNTDPNPIDFGQVEVGKFRDLDVLLKNYGSDAVTVTEIYLRLDGSVDFTIEAFALPEGQSSLPVTLAPGESMGLVMRYEPRGGGADFSALVVAGETQGTVSYWSFDVLGEELGPHLVATPGQLDFQWVPLDQRKDLLLMVANEGNADLVIPDGGITLWPGSDPNIVVEGMTPGQDLVIQPGKSVDLTVGWTPKEVGLLDPGTPIGQVMIASNDLSQSPTPIPVFGRPDAPVLVVIPDAVDLGFGAQMTPVQRQVTLQNAGHGTLHIGAVSIIDVSDTTYGTEIEVVRGNQRGDRLEAFEVAGESSEGILVVFTNRGPDKGTVTATLRIQSDYRGHEVIDVPITVQRSGSPVCNVALMPGGVNFGTVAIGFPEERTVNIINVGTGYCTFRRALIQDCQSGMFGGATCGAPFTGSASRTFLLGGLPPVVKDGLAPGSTTPMTVRFVPPAASPLFGLLNSYSALLAVEVRDELLNKTIVTPTSPSGTYQANILGASGIAKISVLPGEVKFGLTTIGCFSKTYKICIYNSGNAPLKVTDISTVGCTPEVRVKSLPKLPMSVSNGVPKCFEVVYAPQDEGKDTCSVRIQATDQSTPTVMVKLGGEGTRDSHQVDEFTQVTGQEVDILFVIDDSVSMSEEQTRLARSFGDFIGQAAVWNNDYHIGAISVNVVDEDVIGRLNRGDDKVTPRYLTPTSGGNFAKMVQYGSEGGSDSQEAGLQAAQTALSAPLATDTGVPCTSTTDCTSDPNICPDPATCGYSCVNGRCGGYNAGFLRDDAQLEVLILSDEEDQSSAGTAFYVDFFKNIKGWYNLNMMHVNAIVGVEGVPARPSGSGSSTGDCVASDGGTADEGKRYIDVVQQTGGLYDSICKDSYAPIMNQVGTVSFHPKVQFFLSRLADPATVTVQVAGQTCTAGWRYDAPSNSVVFDEQGPCMPQPGQKIRIEYDTLCLTS
ncbi:MAG TPA: choice-of-anchor D domain-containing protein [Myxococcota bacterium]|nr:choice-of-anchor D domain-containing protein [Myxococcota bacterium]HQK49956.1 choice-of-anchor D domain-containing protein [Myxococcota bacterium]